MLGGGIDTMQQVKIAYAQNTITRSSQGLVQELAFTVEVDNLAYDKQVEIHWAGEDDHWHADTATYQLTRADGRELWLAKVQCPLTPQHNLPGTIRFAVRYETMGRIFWDSNHGHNYSLDADCGMVVYSRIPLLHCFHDPVLQGGKVRLPIQTAVRADLEATAVRIHWSTDHWKTKRVSRCLRRANYWHAACDSAARNPNRYGWEIWAGRIPVRQAYRVEYYLEAETPKGVVRDDALGQNYQSRRSSLRVMTLNLHCNQEKDQAAKFKQIAHVIEQLDVDVICFQEVAEDWNDGRGDWATNTARAINGHLPQPYHLFADYSHLGFEKYREGLAILSRHEFTSTDSGYVSESEDIYDIHARRVLMAQIHVPYFGPVNVYSAHLSWVEDGFEEQFERLRSWVNRQHTEEVVASVVCGDFNIAADSAAYSGIVRTGDLQDQYLCATRPDLYEQVFGKAKQNSMRTLNGDGRIDYIWLKTDSELRALSARELFTPTAYGRVSDHPGYLVEFERC